MVLNNNKRFQMISNNTKRILKILKDSENSNDIK